MKITRVSTISGKSNTLDLNVGQHQIDAWKNGMLIQDAMPDLTVNEREFIKSGITPEEWDLTFGE